MSRATTVAPFSRVTPSMVFAPVEDQRPYALVSVRSAKPPPLTTEPLATPADSTSTVPPLLTTVPLATPPDATSASPPLSTTKPEIDPPEAMSSVTIAPLWAVTPSMMFGPVGDQGPPYALVRER